MPLPIHELMNARLINSANGYLFVRLVDYDEKGIRIVACSTTQHPQGGTSDTVFRTDAEGNITEELNYDKMSGADLLKHVVGVLSCNPTLAAALSRRIKTL